MEKDLWLKNFRNSIQQLIKEEIDQGKKIRKIYLTQEIYDTYSEMLGYEPVDIFGYLLTVIIDDVVENNKDNVWIDTRVIH